MLRTLWQWCSHLMGLHYVWKLKLLNIECRFHIGHKQQSPRWKSCLHTLSSFIALTMTMATRGRCRIGYLYFGANWITIMSIIDILLSFFMLHLYELIFHPILTAVIEVSHSKSVCRATDITWIKASNPDWTHIRRGKMNYMVGY